LQLCPCAAGSAALTLRAWRREVPAAVLESSVCTEGARKGEVATKIKLWICIVVQACKLQCTLEGGKEGNFLPQSTSRVAYINVRTLNT